MTAATLNRTQNGDKSVVARPVPARFTTFQTLDHSNYPSGRALGAQEAKDLNVGEQSNARATAPFQFTSYLALSPDKDRRHHLESAWRRFVCIKLLGYLIVFSRKGNARP